MNWIGLFGQILLIISVFILAPVVASFWVEDMAAEEPEAASASASDSSSSPGARTFVEGTRRQLRRRRRRIRRRALAFAVPIFLLSIFLILVAGQPTLPSAPVISNPTPPNIPPGVLIGDIPGVLTGDTKVSLDWRWLWLLIAVAVLLAMAGALLLGATTALKRAAGALLVFASAATSEYALFRNIKFEFSPHFSVERGGSENKCAQLTCEGLAARVRNLVNDLSGAIEAEVKVKLEPEIKAEIEAKIETKLEIELKKIGALGAEHVADFDKFELGRPELTDSMEEARRAACKKWNDRIETKEQGGKHDGLLLLVGETDRVPLGPAAHQQYESNVGLARARAEQVKAVLERSDCGIPANRMLAIVSGPQTTPQEPDKSSPNVVGTAGDRRVEVWAIWGWEAEAQR